MDGVNSSGPCCEVDPARTGAGWARFRWEVLLLTAFVSAVYFSRLDALPFRGEETRWARVAWEMRETGDWIVPRQQGRVFADRPPLNSWCMLLAGEASGGLDRVSVRLPAALATLLTALVLYGYCQQFLSRWGAFSAGLVYATFPQTLQLGRFAESDALFAFLMTAALLVWHTGYVRNWPRIWTWTAGYALAALAGLAKGPQGPVYFVAAVTVFLGLKRDWRCLFGVPHLAGLLTFAAVLGAWQIPFSRAVGAESTMAVWSEEGTLSGRLAGIFGPRWWGHLASYPAEVFLYLLPWSVFLLWLLRPGSWRPRGAIGQHVVFLLVYLAIAFPTCWLTTNARPRHLMAIYPSVACLIATALDRCCFDRSPPRWDPGFRWFLTVTGTVATLMGLGVAIAGIWPVTPRIAAVLAPSSSTAVCGAAILVLAAVCFWARAGSGPSRAAGESAPWRRCSRWASWSWGSTIWRGSPATSTRTLPG
jgi:4-amino-4-deoxy-L-arabinose transferase-like glycosyltransferase